MGQLPWETALASARARLLCARATPPGASRAALLGESRIAVKFREQTFGVLETPKVSKKIP